MGGFLWSRIQARNSHNNDLRYVQEGRNNALSQYSTQSLMTTSSFCKCSTASPKTVLWKRTNWSQGFNNSKRYIFHHLSTTYFQTFSTWLFCQYKLLFMLLVTSQDAAHKQLQTACADWLATAQRELMLLALFSSTSIWISFTQLPRWA